jgi:hypothetical protein
LHKAAGSVEAKLYVPDVVIDEVAYSRWRYLQETFRKIEAVANEIADYAAVTLGDAPDENRTVARPTRR